MNFMKKFTMQTWQPTSKIYVLRSCKKDFSAYGGFKWPKLQGWAETPIYVECPDWKSTSECGNGLHGYAEGKGDGYELKLGGFAQIVEVEKDETIYLDEKCKFPRCNLLFCGSYEEATDFLVKQGYSHPILKATIAVDDNETAVVGNFGTATAGDSGVTTAGDFGIASVGHKGTATAGRCGTAIAGESGTATASDSGTATAGNSGTATAGDSGTATAGKFGTATAGYRGAATTGNYGTATAGYKGTATAGYSGTATAGNFGTATAGNFGIATAGENGEIHIRYYDTRYRTKIGYIGENGLLPNVKYRLNEKFEFEKVK